MRGNQRTAVPSFGFQLICMPAIPQPRVVKGSLYKCYAVQSHTRLLINLSGFTQASTTEQSNTLGLKWYPFSSHVEASFSMGLLLRYAL